MLILDQRNFGTIYTFGIILVTMILIYAIYCICYKRRFPRYPKKDLGKTFSCVKAGSYIDPFHIRGGNWFGLSDMTRELLSYLPQIDAPNGLDIGCTGYPHIYESIRPTYGYFFDEFNRIWIIVDDYLLFQRYPHSSLFMGGELKKHSLITEIIDEDYGYNKLIAKIK